MTHPPISKERAAELAAAETHLANALSEIKHAFDLLKENHGDRAALVQAHTLISCVSARVHREIPQ